MDELTGIGKSDSTSNEQPYSSKDAFSEAAEDSNGSLPSSSSKSFNSTIISQALDFKDWTPEMELKGDRDLLLGTVVEGLKPSSKLFSKRSNSFSRIIKKITRKATRQKSVEILRVVNLCQSNFSVFRWGWVNPPQAGDEIFGSAIPIGGWIVAKESQPIAIRLVLNETALSETLVNIPRPDVIKIHAYESAVCNCGFATTLDVRTLPNKAEVQLQAVFQENFTAPVGSIQFCKYGY